MSRHDDAVRTRLDELVKEAKINSLAESEYIEILVSRLVKDGRVDVEKALHNEEKTPDWAEIGAMLSAVARVTAVEGVK